MKIKRGLCVALIAGLLLLGIVWLNHTQAARADPVIDTEEQTLVNALNEYRVSLGLAPLAFDPVLTTVAEWISNDMAEKNYFNHTDSLGRDPFQRMADLGFAVNTWKGENLAAGSAGGRDVLTLFQNSPAHHELLINPNYRFFGIARNYSAASTFGWYWAVEFAGSPHEVSQSTPPSLPPPPPQEPEDASETEPTIIPTSAAPTPTPTSTPTPTPPAANPDEPAVPSPGAEQGSLQPSPRSSAQTAQSTLLPVIMVAVLGGVIAAGIGASIYRYRKKKK